MKTTIQKLQQQIDNDKSLTNEQIKKITNVIIELKNEPKKYGEKPETVLDYINKNKVK